MSLQIPKHVNLPSMEFDLVQLKKIVKSYTWSNNQNFQWVEEHDLEIVGTYLLYWEAKEYWNIILAGEPKGFSLYLHEFAELDWYFRRNLNPFDEDEQILNYKEAHSFALLYEHRFLQVVAKSMGYSFSLRELIEFNLHGDSPDKDWKGDWIIIASALPNELSKVDRSSDPSRVDKICMFFNSLGFKKMNGYDQV